MTGPHVTVVAANTAACATCGAILARRTPGEPAALWWPYAAAAASGHRIRHQLHHLAHTQKTGSSS